MPLEPLGGLTTRHVLKLALAGLTAGAVSTYLLILTAYADSSDGYDGNGKKERIHTGTFDGRGGWLLIEHLPTFSYTFLGGLFGIGGEQTSYHVLQPEEDNEAYLRSRERKVKVERKNNPVAGWDENVLPSKGDEDAHAIDIVSRADLMTLLEPVSPDSSFWDQRASIRIPPNSDGVVRDGGARGGDDLVMISVFDGHGGSGVSQLLKKSFHACLAWTMANEHEDFGTVEAIEYA